MQSYRTEERRLARLEQYRIVLIEAWRRNGMTNKEVALATGKGISLVSKVKNGRANICAKFRYQLIDLFELDRARLFIAIEVAGNGMLYFDPSFKHVCHASMCFVQEMLTLMDDDVSPEQRALFAAFPDQTIRHVAGQAGSDVTRRLTAIIPTLTRLVEAPRH
jgi:hypothetical protein